MRGSGLVVRSRQKEIRRQAMLDAAEGLIRETASTDFSMLVLAERAGTSPATPYNVFGSKASILYALLVKSLDTIFLDFDKITRTMNPYEVVLFAAREATEFFVADPTYYQPLYHYLIGARDDVYRPAYLDRAFGYWRSALTPLRRDGHLQRDIERDALARSMMILFLGALDLWCQREISHDLFRAQINYGVSAILCGVADDAARADLLQMMDRANLAMPEDFSFERTEPAEA
jgi:AcrR family transcriptional regulator